MALCDTLQQDYTRTEVPPRRKRRILTFLFFLPILIWGCAAFYYGSWNPLLCKALAFTYIAANIYVLVCIRRCSLLIYTALFILPLFSFLFFMRPSHDREWQRDVAELPWTENFGDQIVIHNIRNCTYQSPSNFVVNYETRSYNINDLESIDVSLTDWGLRKIAHTMVSFGFKDGQYLCFSIEARKEIGENYSSSLGFFRQYELIYIVADERDLIKLRTCYRQNEEVRLYRLVKKDKRQIKYIFNGYIKKINALKKKPEWYNALTQNCMTSMLKIARSDPDKDNKAPLHWSMIANGYSDEHAYKLGSLDQSLPFEELREKSLINAKANSVKSAGDFSKEIRRGMPGT